MEGTMKTVPAAALAAALAYGSPAHAHHGVAPHYDTSKPVTIEGVVSRFDFVNPHSFVYVDGVAARHNPTGCAFRVAYFRDGRVLKSTELFAPTRATDADAPADPTSIVGVWAMKRFAVSTYQGQLTEAGERARSAFDPVKDDPAIYCNPASPVRFWVNVNEPFEIRRDGDDVLIVHRFMDATRVVHHGPAAANTPR